MGLFARIFRMPRPRTFLWIMSLRTGTELSTLALVFNKVSGVYGLLALLTGFHLSPLQLSMYIYSVICLVFLAILSRHIRTQSPFHCLALAQLFLLDTIINAAYTAAFGVTWFLVISQHHSDKKGDKQPGVGGSTMGDTAGFTNPEFNVSSVDVAVGPDQGIPGEKHEAVTSGTPGDAGMSSAAGPSLGHGVLQPESFSSVIVIALLWAVRIYLVLVVMSYARLVLRRWVMADAGRNTQLHTGSKSVGIMEDPFAEEKVEGKGWRGRLGRTMVGLGRRYWLGAEEGDEGWMGEEIAMGSLGQSRDRENKGLGERERRRRSGTGPPPPVAIPQMQGQSLPK